jgi:hypothetical protein
MELKSKILLMHFQNTENLWQQPNDALAVRKLMNLGYMQNSVTV